MPDTHKPLPAPYPVGTKVRYVGTHTIYTVEVDGQRLDVQVPGQEFVVKETRPGWQGTGGMVDLGNGDDPFPDETQDGYSVVEAVPGFGRCIPPGSKDWDVVED